MSLSWTRWCITSKKWLRRGLGFLHAARMAAYRFCLLAGGKTKCAASAFRIYPPILYRLLTISLSMLRRKRMVTTTLYKRRLMKCRRCPLFYRPLMTCGNAASTETWINHDRMEPMGCLCYLPIKAMDPTANCWMYERLGETEYGWPAALNGSRKDPAGGQLRAAGDGASPNQFKAQG